MGESSAWLMRSFSQPSPTSQDFQEGDPLRRALTASISFGRFMSESLAWEKWSSFTQNRYLEEVEKYSRPGSVAEKKAYFEARYKRKASNKGDASIEQQNKAVNDIPASSLTNAIDNDSAIEMAEGQEGYYVAIEEKQEEGDPTSDVQEYGQSHLEGYEIESCQIEETGQGIEQPAFVEKLLESSILPDCGQSPLEGCQTESEQIEGTEQGVEQPIFVEKQVESSILPENGQSPLNGRRIENEQIDGIEQGTFVEKRFESSILLKDAQDISVKQEVKAFVEDAAIMGVSAFSDKKKPASSSAKSSGHREESRLRPPRKPTTPMHPKNGDQVTSYSKRTGREFVDRKTSTPKSLHMSINFGSHIGDANKTSSPVHKIVDSRLARNLSRTSRESTKQQTPTRASANGASKHLSVTPQPSSARTKKLLDHPISERMTRDRKSESLYMRSSITSTACRMKAQYPTVSASFNLRTEERATKRKEKLQQKLSMEEAEKEQLKGRLKGNIRNDAKDVRQSIARQGKANVASFHPGMEPLGVQPKKITRTQPYLPGIERKQESEVLHNNSRPTWRQSLKADSFKDLLGNNHGPPTYCTKLFTRKNSMNENTSPNIQV